MGNVAHLFLAAARQRSQSTAIISGTRTVTYSTLSRRVGQLAGAFTASGARPGDRVAVCMSNRPEYLEVLLATLHAGLVIVPINVRLTVGEVEAIVRDADPRLFVVDEERRALAMSFANVQVVVVGASGDDHLGYARLLTSGTRADVPLEVDDGALAWLFYTSGTTGQPKGAMLTHRNLEMLAVLWLADVARLSPGDTVLHATPLSHASGLMSLAGFAVGARHAIPARDSFDPVRVLEDLERYEARSVFLVPTQLRMIMDTGRVGDFDLSRLDALVYGGSPIHEVDLADAIRQFPGKLIQAYAQGETPMTATVLNWSDHLEREGERSLAGSAGCARLCTQLRIVDADARPLPAGTIGQIAVRGPTVMAGYWGRKDDSDKAIRDEWLLTGDLGRMDEHGYLWVLDRMKDMIISGGSNVYAREVEDAILSVPGVRAVAVVGIPDRVWGERVAAAVVPDPGSGLSADKIAESCARALATYKRPRLIVLRDELPLNSYGKVQKRRLREQLATEHSLV